MGAAGRHLAIYAGTDDRKSETHLLATLCVVLTALGIASTARLKERYCSGSAWTSAWQCPADRVDDALEMALGHIGASWQGEYS